MTVNTGTSYVYASAVTSFEGNAGTCQVSWVLANSALLWSSGLYTPYLRYSGGDWNYVVNDQNIDGLVFKLRVIDNY